MTATPCNGYWRHVDTIHGNIDILRCSDCCDRMVVHAGRRVDIPADVMGRKAIVRFIRSTTNH
jgi:hypothetical protein